MGLATAARDWEVTGIAGIGYVAVVGADISAFMFRSRSAGVEEPFVSLTAAAGVSLGAGQVPAADSAIRQAVGSISRGTLNYTAIDVLTPFCFWDLHGCLFTIMQGTVSAVAGYSNAKISAVTYSLGHLFQRQDCSGFTAGVQLSAILTIGTLRSLTYFGSFR